MQTDGRISTNVEEDLGHSLVLRGLEPSVMRKTAIESISGREQIENSCAKLGREESTAWEGGVHSKPGLGGLCPVYWGAAESRAPGRLGKGLQRRGLARERMGVGQDGDAGDTKTWQKKAGRTRMWAEADREG